MAKEIEKAGIPIVVLCNLLDVAKSVGVNKMVQTVSVPYPLGDPEMSPEEEWKLRYHRVGVALDALTKEVEDQTVFPTKI
ncbi:MAG: betaine reductase complex component subunit beta [Thermovirga sp.]|jgi:glycine reductase|nr:MAG: Selenoprotein B, glycine/betaine/sarcosine/D-proline reductase family [Thermovirga lienii]MDN5318302.1 betaine reductase complex component subunit beta [Thermovirga sp.]MDN5367718.1 betaine reductase complex component subunit beta [Thermovirga sp.]